jgi:hypothetical protein
MVTFHNLGFRDPYPEGRTVAIGPSLNIIHSAGAYPVHNEGVDELRGRCYSNSRIPFTSAHIKADAYKEVHQNPLQVIANFLNGHMVNRENARNQRGFEILQIDRAESAFLELGWRIDRQAATEASRDVRNGVVDALINSPAWVDNPPRRVDNYKGKAVAKMMRSFRRRNVDNDSDSEEEDDDDSQNDSSHHSDSDDDDGADDSDGNANPMFVNDNRPGLKEGKGKRKPSKKRKGKQPSREKASTLRPS